MNNRLVLGAVVVMLGCAKQVPVKPVIPALEYTENLKAASFPARARETVTNPQRVGVEMDQSARAQIRLVDGEVVPAVADGASNGAGPLPVSAFDEGIQPSPLLARTYVNPLPLGDPGVSSSLFQESRGTNDMFRDHRAWLPMDLITITVSEKSEGTKEAGTDVKSESTLSAAISKLFGFEADAVKKHPALDPTALISAEATSEFKGEGETTRKGKLTARLSAMVAEVLPSGILRIEGQKITAVNGEEQVMVISGLVRPRDVNSENEVDSSKIANMRIDYFGRGVINEVQSPGWLGRIVRRVWPF